MELQHINVKIPVDGALAVDPVRFIDVFHRWIQDGVLEELLIDVADYRHVPEGPGVVLIAHEADYSMDHTDGQWGLRYNRKAKLDGTNEDRIRQAIGAAVSACVLLEKEFAAAPALRFNRSSFELFINDRALAPNTQESAAELVPLLRSLIGSVLGHSNFTAGHDPDPRRRLGLRITTESPVAVPT